MAKVFIEETTLTAIGDAIRGKTGKTELIDPANMSTEIAGIEAGGGGDLEVPDIVITGEAHYACSGAMAGAFVSLFPTKVTTKDITKTNNMFYNYTGETIPFEINISKGGDAQYMFYGCKNLKATPAVDFKNPTNYQSLGCLFSGCSSLENVAPVINAYPGDMSSLFYGCYDLRELPDDFFSTWNFSRALTYSYAGIQSIFAHCHSLRKLPKSLFEKFNDGWTSSSYYNSLYYSFCENCITLDEILGLPVGGNYTSNAMSGVVNNCFRLKRFTFAVNDDGTPKVAQWKSQTLNLHSSIGYAPYYDDSILRTNTSITKDEEVIDTASYNALKDNPDWWTKDDYYSRYNHDSAVETINSLPDTSEYLTSVGGTNTVKFLGRAGLYTDGGAINTLTEAEIAVAAAKGWTVTLT